MSKPAPSRRVDGSAGRSGRHRRALQLLGSIALAILVVGWTPVGASGPAQDVATLARETSLAPLQGPDGDRLPFETHAALRDFLRDAEIVDREMLDMGTTQPERITLRRDDVTLRAIFRHVAEQRDRIRLAEGPTYMRFYDSAIFEVAAYELGLLLGLDNIPPAVVRRVDGRRGSVQVWIERGFTDGDRIERELQPADFERWLRQRADMKVFDALAYNADRNTGNVLYDPSWNLWMIDHTRTFQRPTGPVDLSGVSRISDQLWERLREVTPGAVRQVIEPYLEPPQISAVLERRAAIIEHFEELVRSRGAGAVILR